MYIVGNCFVHAERRVEKHAFKAAKSLRASQTSNRGRGGRGRGSRASRGSRGGAGGRGALAGREGADSDDADVAANHEKDLSEHTVPQLRAMLREKGLPTSGLKSVLIDRVTAALMDNSASGGAHGTTEASVGAGLGGASSQDQAAASAAAGENTNGSAAASAPDDSQPQQDKQQDTLVIDVLYFEVAMAIEVDGILGPLRGIAIEVDGVLGPLRDVTTPVLPINYNPTPTNKPYILTPKPQAAGRLIRELQERKHDIQDGSYIPEEFRDLVLNRSSQFPYWR